MIIGVVAANKPGSLATHTVRPFLISKYRNSAPSIDMSAKEDFARFLPAVLRARSGSLYLTSRWKTDEQRQQLTPYRVFGAMKITIGTLFASGNALDPRL